MSDSPTPVSTGRGVVATWWYTFTSALFFAGAVLFVWALPIGFRPGAAALAGFIVAATVWMAAFVALGLGYFAQRDVSASRMRRLRPFAVVTGALAAGVVGVLAPSATLALSLVAALLCALPWPRGVRARVTALVTAVLAILAALEFTRAVDGEEAIVYGPVLVMHVFAAALPITVVSMLWWWDIVRELDGARQTEARLAATQERLRLASDVHDLQGHHLQVVALQLELAERLSDDPPAALEHIRAARRQVDEARTGTRALAARFRGVPLPDELANAADLLRAAGLRVELTVAPDAAEAPRDALGPVVRESTTNILKHGGGRFARLRLERDDGGWRYRAENDRLEASETAAGDGIRGMTARMAEAGGSLDADAGAAVFALDARVPAS